MVIGLVAIIVVGAASPSSGRAATDADAARLLSPTLGRPVFVSAGSAFAVRAVAPLGSTQVECALLRADSPAQRIRLQPAGDAAARLAAGEALALTVPLDTPRRTYDLEVRVGAAVLRGRHSVAVTEADDPVRLVHLSNMNVGDLSAPEFDDRLVSEINLVAPTAIVMTGDYLDATHPNPRAGWQDLVSFVLRLDAPVILACGDHDDIGLYSEFAAPSPVGVIQVGRHRGVVLFDHPGAPIDRDADQIRWVESLTRMAGGDGLTFVISHDDYPNLLAYWQRAGSLEGTIRDGRVGVWISGGHLDWDGVENAALVAAAAPMRYVRTHQAGRATLGGASGTAHYRVIDLDGDRVRMPSERTATRAPAPSTPVGHLWAEALDVNDGSQTRVGFRANSTLPYAIDRNALWLRVRKTGEGRPWCHGGRIDEIIEQSSFWECRVRFDLPDKSMVRGEIGAGPEPLYADHLVEFQIEEVLEFHERATPDGLQYLEAAGPTGFVEIVNNGSRSLALAPQVRLDGEPIAYRPVGVDQPFVTRMSLTIDPGARVRLQVDFSAVRVTAGRRTLQVYAESATAVVPSVHPVDIRVVR
jgi:hypothetical protein